MSSGAKVDSAVFDFLRPQLQRYRRQTTDLKAAVARSIAKASETAAEVVRDRRSAVEKCRADLDACRAQENSDCSGYARQLELAANALADALKGQRIIEQATVQFRHSQARHDRVIDEELVRSEKLVREADERISGYVKATISGPHVTLLSGAASGGGGSWSAGSVAASSAASPDCYSNGTGDASAPASWRDTPGVTIPAGFPDGFALVPVSLIRNSDPISGPESFDKGQDLPTLKWSTNALLDVLLPAMRSGDPRATLRERDQREGLSGARTYMRSYSGFFSDTALKVSHLGPEGFDLDNGRHRLWLLERLGATEIPVRIVGPQ